MRLLLRVLAVLMLLVVLVLAGGYVYLRRSLPVTSGTVILSGLDGEVEIVRDADGVPHIFATTDHDAFFAQGYVHAQDRMHVAAGFSAARGSRVLERGVGGVHARCG